MAEIASGFTGCRSRPRRLRGRLQLGGRLQDPEEGRLRRERRPEPNIIAGRRRGGHEAHPGPAEYACHSCWPLLWWSGVTEAGNDPRVAGLVYIAAFAPDRGESVMDVIALLSKAQKPN
jgi:hypothetical protein